MESTTYALPATLHWYLPFCTGTNETALRWPGLAWTWWHLVGQDAVFERQLQAV